VQSDKMAPNVKVCTKQRYITEFLCVEEIALVDIHRCLLNVDGDQTVDVGTGRWWVVCFVSGNSDVRDGPCSGRPWTVVSSGNDDHLHRLIHTDRQISQETLYGAEFPESG
jgi:hypothetical protein